MATKRKRGEPEDLATEDVGTMTVDMANELRAKLIQQQRRKTKKRIRKGPTINVDHTRQTHDLASFLGLPHELRDRVYQFLWSESLAIKQQYLNSTDSEDAVRKIKMYISVGQARARKVGYIHASWCRAVQKFDYTKLHRLAVHRGLRTLEVEIRVVEKHQFDEVEHLKPSLDNLIAELKNVGQALVPGGIATEVHTEVPWAWENGAKCFEFRVDKD